MDSDSMSGDSGPRYYVRARGRVQGPYSVEKLRSLRKRGHFSRIFEVSTDRRHWQPASQVLPDDVKADDAASAAVDPPVAEAETALHQQLVHSEASAQAANERARPPRIPSPQPGGSSPVQTSPQVKSLMIALAFISGLVIATLVPILLDREATHPSRSGTNDDQSGLAEDEPIPESTPFLPEPPDDSFNDLVVTNVEDAPQESQAPLDILAEDAVGLVVCGVRMTLADGTVKEIATGTGSCFLISAEGHALTNSHVLDALDTSNPAVVELLTELRGEWGPFEHEPHATVFFNGERHTATVVDRSDVYDLAVLETDQLGVPFFHLSAHDSLPRSTRVYALGFPGAARSATSTEEEYADFLKVVLALAPEVTTRVEDLFKERDFVYTQTEGSVSRVVPEEGRSRIVIQHNADLNPGNSGGPLVTSDGLVWAINTQTVPGASGIHTSYATGQFRREIDSSVPGITWVE